MQRKWSMAIAILTAGLFLWGCGGKEQDNIGQLGTTIDLQKDGSVVVSIVDEFSPDLYSSDGLKEMILSEAAAFIQENPQHKVTVDKIEEKDALVEVVMTYSSADAYTAFNADAYNGDTIFYGKVKDAYDAGISLDTTLHHVKNEETISKDGLMQLGDRNILIMGKPATIRTKSNITYISDGITVSGKKTATLTKPEGAETTGLYYIVF